MYVIYLLFTIGVVVVNIAGLTAWVSRYLPLQASARLLGLVSFTLILFALEHVHGFGSFAWLWPLTTAAAVMQLRRRCDRLFWMGEAVFVLGVGYGLIWRYAFPNIDAGSEHLTDLYFISNFIDGPTLPAADHWFAGNVFDFYYPLQYYGAALLARLFRLDIGLAMNVSWALLLGLLVSLAWEISGYFVQRLAFRGLLLVAVIAGGNGLSPLMPWMIDNTVDNNASAQEQVLQRVWASTRFAGMYEQQVNTSLGRAVADLTPPEEPNAHLELPMETIAYYSVLGDYHPPLGGFVIALWTLALTGFLGSRTVIVQPVSRVGLFASVSVADALVFFCIGLTPALILATNAWVLPMQGILVASWLVFRQWQADIHWPALLMGGVTGFSLIYAFLGYFAASTPGTELRLVDMSLHTPVRFFLAMHWPLILWLGVGLILARRSPWAGWLALTLLLLFCGSEWIYVDDPLSGKYQRFNSTLKWWSWLWPTALIGLGSAALGLGGRLVKGLMILSLSALLMYSVDIARYWQHTHKSQWGKLSGDGWLKQDASQREMLAYLKQSPPGLVMESLLQGAYSSSSALALFANRPLLAGWPDHLTQWHGQSGSILKRVADIRAFYKGELTDPLEFLGKFPVQTIIWTYTDEQRNPGIRIQLQAQLNRDYHWRGFYRNGSQMAGLWERRSAAVAAQS